MADTSSITFIVGVFIAIILSLVFAYIFLANYIEYLIEKTILRKSLNLCFYEIILPQNNEVEIKAAEQMFTGLVGIGEKVVGMQRLFNARTFVSFEVVAFRENIKFYVVCPKKIASVIDKQINGTYPQAEIIKSKEYNLFPEHAYVSYAGLTLAEENKVPVQTYEDLPVDTMATLTDTFSKLGIGEAAAFQLVISPAGSEWRNQAKEYVRTSKENNADPEKKTKVSEDTIALVDKKANKSGFHVDTRIIVVSQDKGAADSHLSNILSVFDQYTKEGGNRFKKLKDKKTKKIVKDFIYRIPRESMILNTEELATLFHFPNKNITTPYIKWLLAKKAPASDLVASSFQKDYMYIGKNKFRGGEKEVFLKPEDRLRHLYVIGQTGTGKSGFMGGLMMRDIKMGHGCAFIDPHGSDAQKILEQIPPERVEDVIIFDPADLERPIGLNMLEFNSDAERTLITDQMLNIFDTLYDLKKTGGPMFEQYFRYGIMLITEDIESGSTLLEIPKIFADDDYRNYKLNKCQNQEVIDFWRKQAEKAGGDVSLKNVTPYVTSKLAPFLTNAYIRPIIAQQKSTINFRELMDDGKILIAKLSKGRIGDMNAYLLGMVLVTKMLVAALSRDDIPEAQRRPFYLYIDEFQNFLTDGINIILSEARKYRLALTIGHQYLGQLVRPGGDSKIRDAIFGNVGNKAIFRVGIEDAKTLQSVFDGYFNETDLSQVENLNYFVSMLVDGKPVPPFSLSSIYGQSPFDMFTTPNPELAEIIKNISRLKYGRDKNIIENEVRLRGSNIKPKEEKQMPNFDGFPSFKV